MGASATTVTQLFESVRFRKIHMWSQASPTQAAIMISFNMSGTAAGITGANNEVNATAVGMTDVAKLIYKANPTTQGGQWQRGDTTAAQPGTDILFTINAPFGTIVDLYLELAMTGDTRVANNTTAITGPATLGQIYYLALDNNAGGSGSGSSIFDPVPSLITIS